MQVEWSGGSETMEEILGKIHQREEAAVKRERAMAYAFSHQVGLLVLGMSQYLVLPYPTDNHITCIYYESYQWRANSSQSQVLGSYEVSKANWGWSWKERWIAARPWESRISSLSVTPEKAQHKQPSKVEKDKNTSTPKTPVSVKPPLAIAKGTPPSANAKGNSKARRLSYPPTAQKTVVQGVQ